MFVFSLVLIAVLIAADQIIKLIVDSTLAVGEIVEVIKFGDFKLFSLNHVRNSGAAWSMMQGKTWFLVGVPLIICGLGIYYIYKRREHSRLELVSLSMLVAGGVGNLIDRIRLHEVIDYIKFEPFNFPVFNFADICVVIGALLFAVYIIFLDKPEKKTAEDDVQSSDLNVKEQKNDE
jgi:signal peptidase II